FTNCIFMDLVHQKRISVKDPIQMYLPWFSNHKLKIENLLSHTSGMPWWNAYYKKISLEQPREIRWMQLKEEVAKEKPQVCKKAVYSDLDYFFLGFILQSVFNSPLIDIWKTTMQGDFHFNIDNQPTYKKSLYAPTEKCPWRKKILQGEVHDENAWALGGVSTHAGLFSTMEALVTYGLNLRSQFYDHPKSLDLFFKKATSKGDWTLGFMQPSKEGSSSGEYFSPKSIGHTGFVGTSLWFDPKLDLLVCILSNRVHPSRDNRKFVVLRPEIHNAIVRGVLDV
ncbi:MAG: serine hydrolase, partial [Bdellovibrionales bacterium]|nr:serine hydrolase [Bdellovibrionales bacterium]